MLDVDIDGDEHIRLEPVSTLSFLSPYSGLILAIVLIILYLVKQYLLESILLRRCYGAYFTDLNESNRRGFVNHHIAGGVKLIILCAGVYPFVSVAFRSATLRTPYARGSKVQMGDVLVVAAQMLSAMYVFELIYRVRISYVSAMHHIGAILVTQAVIAISLTDPPERDASVEFILLTVWGAFDVVCELLPHLAMILYRVYPTSHQFLRLLFMISCFATFGGTIFETIVVFYLFGSLWSEWKLQFKIITPILHCAFSATQLHGSRIFFTLWRKQIRYIRDHYDIQAGNQGVEAPAPVLGLVQEKGTDAEMGGR